MSRQSTIVGPLNFAPHTKECNRINRTNVSVSCLFCSEAYRFSSEKDQYLAHLFLKHNFVIAEEHQIAFIDEYLLYWNEKFKGT